MSTRRRLLSALGVLCLSFAGMAGAQPLKAGPQLGQNLAGEPCRASGDLTQARPVDIFCGDDRQSAGSLRFTTLVASLPAEPAARRAAVLASAKTVASALSIEEQLSCDPGQFLGESASSPVLVLCTAQSNSWPRILVVS